MNIFTSALKKTAFHTFHDIVQFLLILNWERERELVVIVRHDSHTNCRNTLIEVSLYQIT